MPELCLQALATALLLLSRNWFAAVAEALLLGYSLHLYLSGKIFIDTPEAFRQLPAQKKQRLIMLGGSLAMFVFIVYR